MQGSTHATYYVFSLIETTIELQQKVWYVTDAICPKVPAAISESNTGNSNDNSPMNPRCTASDMTPSNVSSTIHIDFIEDSRIRKIRDDIFTISCIQEFKFCGRFYTLSRQALTKVYRGENFLFRANLEVQSTSDLDIFDTFFICVSRSAF